MVEFGCIVLFAFDLWLTVCTTAHVVSSSHCRVIPFYMYMYTHRHCFFYSPKAKYWRPILTAWNLLGARVHLKWHFSEKVNVRACAPIHTSRPVKCVSKLSVELCVSGSSVVVGGGHAVGRGPYRT